MSFHDGRSSGCVEHRQGEARRIARLDQPVLMERLRLAGERGLVAGVVADDVGIGRQGRRVVGDQRILILGVRTPWRDRSARPGVPI